MSVPWYRWLVPRYSLRTLMLVMLVSMMVVGLATRDLSQRRTASARDRQVLRELDEHEEESPSSERESIDFKSSMATVTLQQQVPTWALLFLAPNDMDAYIRVTQIRPFAERIDDSRCALLAQLTALKGLDLNDQPLTDACLPHLAALPRLEELSLARTRITGKQLEPLARLTRLRVLHLDDCPLAPEAWDTICRLTELRSLSISGTPAGDAELEKLGAHLERLEEIQLNGDLVSDAHLRPLLRLKRLRKITSIGKITFNDDTMEVESPSQTILSHVEVDRRWDANDTPPKVEKK